VLITSTILRGSASSIIDTTSRKWTRNVAMSHQDRRTLFRSLQQALLFAFVLVILLSAVGWLLKERTPPHPGELPPTPAHSALQDPPPLSPSATPFRPGVSADLAVTGTLSLVNGTLLPGNTVPFNGLHPRALGINAAGDLLFVASSAPAIAVFNVQYAQSPIAWIPVNGSVGGFITDPLTNWLFVTLTDRNAVAIINASSLQLQRILPAGLQPEGGGFDALQGEILVANSGSTNLSVFNGSTGNPIGSVAAGSAPESVVPVLTAGSIYVMNRISNNLTVLNATNLTAVGSIPVASGPVAAAFDSSTGTLWVAGAGNASDPQATVTPVNPFTGTAGTSVVVAPNSIARGIAYFPPTREVYVSHQLANAPDPFSEPSCAYAADPAVPYPFLVARYPHNVTVLNGTGSFVGNVTTGTNPGALLYDAAQGTLFVENELTANVSELHSGFSNPVATFTVGLQPSSIAVAWANDELFVPNNLGNTGQPSTTFAIGAEDLAVHSILRAGIAPVAATYDARTQRVYVANHDSWALSVYPVMPDRWQFDQQVPISPLGLQGGNCFNQTATTFVCFDRPSSIVWDPANDSIALEASDYQAEKPCHFGVPTGAVILENTTYAGPVANTESGFNTSGPIGEGIVFDPLSKELYYACGKCGVVYGLNASVFQGSSTPNNRNIVTGGFPTALAVDSTHERLYVLDTGGGNISAYNLSSQQIESVFSPGGSGKPVALTYDPVVDRILVVYEAGWLLELDPTSGQVTGNLSLPEGPVAIAYDALNGNAYVADNLSGAISVLAPLAPAPRYPLTFSETGLAAGTSWSVSVDGQVVRASRTSLQFNVTTGTHYFEVGYLFNWTTKPLDQGFVTLGSAPRTVQLTFRNLGLYPVRFSEFGLPGGTEWNMTFNGSFAFTLGNSVPYFAPNGSYAFTVTAPPSYIAFPAAGNLTVRGAPVLQTIRFESVVQLRYPVVFVASGIPMGTRWAVEVNGSHFSSPTFSISVSLWNGSYLFAVQPVASYTAEPVGGQVNVTGAVQQVNVTFSPRETSGSQGSPAPWLSLPVALGLGGAGGGAALIAAVWIVRRRRTPAPPTPPEPDDGLD
jgi:YVTN family beta-propeller protein